MKQTQDSTISEQAAECLWALEINASDPRTRLRWRNWLAESVDHRRAFEACRATWRLAVDAPVTPPTTAELAEDTYDGEAPVAWLRSRRPMPHAVPGAAIQSESKGLPRSAWMTLAAASLLLAAVVGAAQLRPGVDRPAPMPVVYETGRGEERQLTLPDGSAIMIGPEAHLEVLLLPRERTFRLTAGEAIFTAAHDPARPFRVYAGSGWIEDIGTAFDVRSDPDHVTVTVIQGAVAVAVGTSGAAAGSTVKLLQNQQVSFGATEGAVHTVDAQQATAWRTGQLAYVDQPLDKVVAELGRYSMKDIVMQDPAIGALHYTGTVSIDELDHWATGLARVYPVQVQILDDRLILTAKRKDR